MKTTWLWLREYLVLLTPAYWRSGGQDSTVKLFNALSGECLHVLPGLESGTGSIAFSPAGLGRPSGLIAGGGWNGKLVLWDVAVRVL